GPHDGLPCWWISAERTPTCSARCAAAHVVRSVGAMTGLDAVDHALLRELQEDARRSNRELAAAVHVSPSTSSERVRALRADGVIRGYHADVALDALGRRVQALTHGTIRPPPRTTLY